jgi:hypothetical protein
MEGCQLMCQHLFRTRLRKGAGWPRLIPLAILWLPCVLQAAMADGIAPPAATRQLDDLSNLVETHQITRVEILHVSDILETLTTITPEMLRKLCRVKVVLERPWESASFGRLVKSLQGLRSADARRPGEVRWAILFFDGSGNERAAIYMGVDGTLGDVCGNWLNLDGSLLRWARSLVRTSFLARY